jgi:hypothetical protein
MSFAKIVWSKWCPSTWLHNGERYGIFRMDDMGEEYRVGYAGWAHYADF